MRLLRQRINVANVPYYILRFTGNGTQDQVYNLTGNQTAPKPLLATLIFVLVVGLILRSIPQSVIII
jgi:hypothetical protein